MGAPACAEAFGLFDATMRCRKIEGRVSLQDCRSGGIHRCYETQTRGLALSEEFRALDTRCSRLVWARYNKWRVMAEKDKFQGLCILQMMWADPEPFAQPACSITADRKGMIGGPRMRLVKGDMKSNNLGTGKKRIGLQATGGEAGLPSAARSKFEGYTQSDLVDVPLRWGDHSADLPNYPLGLQHVIAEKSRKQMSILSAGTQSSPNPQAV